MRKRRGHKSIYYDIETGRVAPAESFYPHKCWKRKYRYVFLGSYYTIPSGVVIEGILNKNSIYAYKGLIEQSKGI